MRKWILLLCISFPLYAQQSIDGDIWLDVGFLGYSPWEKEDWIFPSRPDAQTDSDQTEELYQLLKRESRYLLSAMIYGWHVRYQPPDSSSGVEEIFQIELSGEIPGSTRMLQITDSWQQDKQFYIHIRYWLSENEQLRRESQLSNRYVDSGGLGSAPPFGEIPRQAAIEEAIKQSIRNYLRPRVRNRPREINAKVYLRDMPVFSTAAASYKCQILVKLDLDPLVEYPNN